MRDKAELDKNLSLKIDEIALLQARLKEVEISYKVQIENIQKRLTKERNSDLEKQYNAQIEQLYQQISDLETKNYNDQQQYSS